MQEETETLAYSYGCPASFDLPGEAVEQLFLANRLWNRLVEIHREHEAAKAAVWVSDPAVAAVQETLDAAEEAVAGVYEQARRSRVADRTTVPRDEDKAALERARAARDAARDARDAARAAALPGLREKFAAAKQARFAAVKASCAEFTRAGLGWGTVGDVTRRRFAAAVARVEEQRKAGQPADLRFRRFDGTGTLTVKVMHQAGQPSRTVPALNSGTHPRSGVMRLEPWADPAGGRPKGTARHGILFLTAGRSREHGPLRLEIPVVMDRYLPASADVAEVKVTRFRQGARYRVKVSLAVSQPYARPAAAPGGASVAVRLSWRAAGGGWVSVAHVGSSVPLAPLPPGLGEIVRLAEDGRSAEVYYHPVWRRLLDRDAGIRSIRDQNLDVLRRKLALMLREDEALAGTLGITAADVQRWRSPRRYARLTAPARPASGDPVPPEGAARMAAQAEWAAAEQAWKDAHPVGQRRAGWRRQMLADVSAALGKQRPGRPSRLPAGHPAGVLLEEWQHRDRHLLEFESHESAQVLARRRDAYRCVAAWLCTGTGEVVVDATELDREKRAPGDVREDPEGARGARRLLHAAAPGALREAVIAAAGRCRIPVTMVREKGKGTW